MPTLDNTQLWAFSRDQVAALTKLTPRQLASWQKSGFYAPSYNGSEHFYSFRDVVALRTIASLRKSVSMQELRRVGEWLRQFHETPWASLKLYQGGRHVYVREPSTDAILARVPENQMVIPIALDLIAAEALDDAKAMRGRKAADVGRVTEMRKGVFVVAGTRVATEAIASMAADGLSSDEILRAYPTLERPDIEAALEHERSRRRSA